jgi:asparagine synthetase B (glutamine-hydrolysing)
MPGLIAVRSSESRAADLLDAAAAPLLRGPRERLDVHVSDRGDVALGFAGLRGGIAVHAESGCVAVFDGELISDLPLTGNQAAETLLAAYLRDGERAELPEGSYAAAIWDERSRGIVACTDRYASRPLYVHHLDGDTVVAGELKGIVAAFPDRKWRLDLQHVAEFLAYEHLFPGSTLLEGVRAAPPGTTTVLGEDGERRHGRWRYRLEPAPTADERELTEEFGRLLDRAVRRRVTDKTVLAISGGLDSRCMAVSLVRQGLTVPAVSYGAVETTDLVLGAEVSRRLGLPHHALELQPGYLAKYAPDAVWLSDARLRCLACHHLSLPEVRASLGADSILIGFSGDDVVRWEPPPSASSWPSFAKGVHERRATCLSDRLVEQLLTPQLATELRGRAEAGLTAELRADEGTRAERFAQLCFRNIQAPTLFEDHFAARDPFADHDLVDFARRLPLRLRVGGRLQHLFLAQHAELAGLPSGAKRSRLLRRRTARQEGIGSYAADLRDASRRLLDILVDDRTRQREQLVPEQMRLLVERTAAGALTDMRPLGMLLTLELFQRQFLDGDRLGGGARGAPRATALERLAPERRRGGDRAAGAFV